MLFKFWEQYYEASSLVSMKIGPHSKNIAENNTENPGKLLDICNSLQLLQSNWKNQKYYLDL